MFLNGMYVLQVGQTQTKGYCYSVEEKDVRSELARSRGDSSLREQYPQKGTPRRLVASALSLQTQLKMGFFSSIRQVYNLWKEDAFLTAHGGCANLPPLPSSPHHVPGHTTWPLVTSVW